MKAISTFRNSIDANIAKGLLENNGIPCHDNFDAFNQLWPTNGVKLFVDDQDELAAIALLKEHDLYTT